jgi:nitrite reductase (NO-forming)
VTLPDRRALGRTAWHLRVGWLPLAWLVSAMIATIGAILLDAPVWLPVHLLLLGAVSNAILIWSAHFAAALQRLPDGASHREQAARLTVFNCGALAVVVAMLVSAPWLLIAGALPVAAAVGWHAAALLRRMRRALPSRFGLTVRYYVAAAALLPIGVAIGVLMAPDDLGDDVHAQLALAHVTVNVLGWVGLTLVGTLVTLWPTMLHTQVADGTIQATRRALPVLLLGVAATATGALLYLRWIAVAGLATYLCGLAIIAVPLARARPWRTAYRYAPRSVLAASTWLVACIAILGVILATASSWQAAADRADPLAAPLLAGFAAQLVIGALSFLIPVVLGGGPSIARSTNEVLDSAGTVRLIAMNAGVSIAALSSGWPRVGAGLAILVAFSWFLVLVYRAVMLAQHARA